MSTTDLPLHVRQRIESRWSAQMKRMQEDRDRKPVLGEGVLEISMDDGGEQGVSASMSTTDNQASAPRKA